jgi:Uma2 family endonuclease
MRMVVPTFHTADMVRALPEDGNRYETVHGELLVTPAPRAWHQEVVRRLLVELSAFTTRTGIGHVFHSPADISWSPDTLVQPDVFVADLAEARTLEWSRIRHLLLAIEVLSPSSARSDRFTKRRLYQEVGVPVYWVVDPDERTVEVWAPTNTFPTVERERVSWQPEGGTGSMVIELAELFRPV